MARSCPERSADARVQWKDVTEVASIFHSLPSCASSCLGLRGVKDNAELGDDISTEDRGNEYKVKIRDRIQAAS